MSGKTYTLDELRMYRSDLMQRMAANARHGREYWTDSDERWESLNRARALLRANTSPVLTAEQVKEVAAWGLLSPKDDLVLEGVVDAPSPVVRGAQRRERDYNRVVSLLRKEEG
jgi:hypothetical protein